VFAEHFTEDFRQYFFGRFRPLAFAVSGGRGNRGLSRQSSMLPFPLSARYVPALFLV
jgi:hypothetical protein